MTLGDAIKAALERDDAMAAGRIVDRLRIEFGLNRTGCIAMFRRHAPGLFTDADFEALMERADEVRDPRL